MENKKYTDTIPTPKKYQKSIKLIEKFEAMTSDERKAYLDKLEARIKEIKAFSDYIDRKIYAPTSDDEKAFFDSLKTTGEIVISSAVLGMAYAPKNFMTESALASGLAMSGLLTASEPISDEVKLAKYTKELDKLLEEWVACSIVENTSAQEREM